MQYFSFGNTFSYCPVLNQSEYLQVYKITRHKAKWVHLGIRGEPIQHSRNRIASDEGAHKSPIGILLYRPNPVRSSRLRIHISTGTSSKAPPYIRMQACLQITVVPQAERAIETRPLQRGTAVNYGSSNIFPDGRRHPIRGRLLCPACPNFERHLTRERFRFELLT